ncbi:MAG: AbrB/MazE/SpoVT family DNA-binding domain-containing protein [Chloroflexota bacterium]
MTRPIATARIDSRNRVTVPASVRQRLVVRPGDYLEFILDRDRVEVRRAKRSITDFYGTFASTTDLSREEARERAWAEATRRLVTDTADEEDR